MTDGQTKQISHLACACETRLKHGSSGGGSGPAHLISTENGDRASAAILNKRCRWEPVLKNGSPGSKWTAVAASQVMATADGECAARRKEAVEEVVDPGVSGSYRLRLSRDVAKRWNRWMRRAPMRSTMMRSTQWARREGGECLRFWYFWKLPRKL
ncbi:uncharacterized protein G6M90_00g072370 [Metarhizium brunneum]|uniref:Uncharacterized protein n=1 Tax=Metarhizium brunneum TaxID=500148 RepID=A0A7D5YV41_9HYPO|nr:hypothetical protein G6M90_00g072370 [Metarhizium brunneum]